MVRVLSDSLLKRRWSSDDLREVKRRKLAGIASPEESALFSFLVQKALPAYCRHRYGREETLRAYLAGWDPPVEAVAARAAVSVRTTFAWVSSFLVFAAGYIHHAAERKDLQDWTRSYCDMTHGQAGGSGKTPAIGRREHSAGTCPACEERSR